MISIIVGAILIGACILVLSLAKSASIADSKMEEIMSRKEHIK